ncbi:MAG: winged helix DNA-binding protein [Bacteroidia bacterium]|nr:winged helix DNA-binding protein [Bacteroidia bacterium]
MNPNNKLVELVNRWHTYESSNPGVEIADFCRYYLAQQKQIPLSDSGLLPEEADMSLESELARAVGRLTRFSYFYSKKALAELNLNNLEDFLYLLSVQMMGTPRKSELIRNHLSEFTSGIEVIKRLTRLELLYEFQDPDDKRSKRLRITEKGQQILRECFPPMEKVAHLVFGFLTEDEKHIVLHLLDKLDHIHSDLHPQIRNKSWDETQAQAQAKLAEVNSKTA